MIKVKEYSHHITGTARVVVKLTLIQRIKVVLGGNIEVVVIEEAILPDEMKEKIYKSINKQLLASGEEYKPPMTWMRDKEEVLHCYDPLSETTKYKVRGSSMSSNTYDKAVEKDENQTGFTFGTGLGNDNICECDYYIKQAVLKQNNYIADEMPIEQ